MVEAVTKPSKKATRSHKSAAPPQVPRQVARAWLQEDWRRPGPPKVLETVRFFPDYLADLPVWGVDWHNPPFSRELLIDLVQWQNDFDDHSDGEWPDDEWSRWVAEGQVLVERVRRELGPDVEVQDLSPTDVET
jgi:hypothetical protein